jgi:hypothetical protein
MRETGAPALRDQWAEQAAAIGVSTKNGSEVSRADVQPARRNVYPRQLAAVMLSAHTGRMFVDRLRRSA